MSHRTLLTLDDDVGDNSEKVVIEKRVFLRGLPKIIGYFGREPWSSG